MAASVTIDAFTATVLSSKGLSLEDLEPLTTLVVRTRNSVYRIVVSTGTSVVVHGGPYFPTPTPAHLDGASWGGGLLKLGWIGVGLRMEFRTAEQRIVTSPIRTIGAESVTADTVTH